MTVTDPASGILTRFSPVSREVHTNLRWRKPAGYLHGADVTYVPVVRNELADVGVAMPIAFAQSQGRYVAVALLSLAPRNNVFVTSQGQWIGRYIPFVLRSYPFRLLRVEGTQNHALAVANEAVTRPDVDRTAEAFYDAEGKFTPEVQRYVNALAELERNRAITELAMESLAQEGVICPWEIKQKIDGRDQIITGLFRIDELALSSLNNDAFLRLREATALPVAFAQLFSMGQVPVLAQLATLKDKIGPHAQGDSTLAPARPAGAPSDAFGMVDDQSLRFE